MGEQNSIFLKCNLEKQDPILTVGQVFKIHCSKDFAGDIEQIKLLNKNMVEGVFQGNNLNPYQLKLLKMDLDQAEGIDFEVVSYVVGEHSLQQLKINFQKDLEASTTLHLGDFNKISVQSVLDPKQPQAEPYGPRGPIYFGTPLFFYIFWFCLIGLMMHFLYRKIKKYLDRKKLVEQLQSHGSRLSPLHQLMQTLRTLKKKQEFFQNRVSDSMLAIDMTMDEKKEFMNQLETAYKLFLGRQFMIPTQQWTDQEILMDLKNNHFQVYQKYENKIKDLLHEFSESKKTIDRLEIQDLAQFIEWSKSNAELLYQAGGKNQ